MKNEKPARSARCREVSLSNSVARRAMIKKSSGINPKIIVILESKLNVENFSRNDVWSFCGTIDCVVIFGESINIVWHDPKARACIIPLVLKVRNYFRYKARPRSDKESRS